MCNTKQSYKSSSRPSQSTSQTDRIKLPQSSHHHSLPSYSYYSPYHRYIPYEPYGIHHHPIPPNCPLSCYNNNNHENLNEIVSESKGKSWLLIILLIVILIALGFALYRIISRTSQRFRTIRENNPVTSIQTVRRQKDAIQNCPAEFVRCIGMISEFKKECSMPCEQCKKFPVMMSSKKIFEKMQNKKSNDEIDENENTLNRGIINIPRSKINIATDVSSLNTINADNRL
ncbi:hypothetical protein M0804_012250 [Polistes exclamans]|nr:hypothetical protein M0804_012250 [Polistes exclamans]